MHTAFTAHDKEAALSEANAELQRLLPLARDNLEAHLSATHRRPVRVIMPDIVIREIEDPPQRILLIPIE